MTTVEDALGDIAAYVGTLTAEECLGELLHMSRKAQSFSAQSGPEALGRLGSVLFPVACLIAEQLVTRCEIKPERPDESTLHTCTLIERAHNVAINPPDAGAGS